MSVAWVCINKIEPEIRRRIELSGSSHSSGGGGSSSSSGSGDKDKNDDDKNKDSSSSGSGSSSSSVLKSSIEKQISNWSFGNSSIVVLHRSPIRVFYESKKEAHDDDYHDYNPKHVSVCSVVCVV